MYGGEDEQYCTYISPEAYQALADWIDFRLKSGEIINSDSWVMRNLWDNRVTKGKGWINHSQEIEISGVKALVENAIGLRDYAKNFLQEKGDTNSKQTMVLGSSSKRGPNK